MDKQRKEEYLKEDLYYARKVLANLKLLQINRPFVKQEWEGRIEDIEKELKEGVEDEKNKGSV